MSKKQNLLLGTILLTGASFLSRFMGFFFRIFLSRVFSEEDIGIYQLIFPIYALCFSITSAGIELALSRNVAKEISLGNKRKATFFLYISLLFSLILSLFTMKFLQKNSSLFAIYILGDMRCEPFIVAISHALPFASIHSCICGYYLGLKQAKITAWSQLIEQSVRIGSTILLCQSAPNILFAVHGIVLSEFFSSLFCIWYYSRNDFCLIPRKYLCKFTHFSKELLSLTLPLTANRVLTNLLQSMESISIPLCLQKYGHSTSEALGLFGVLTGMALPCILFPSAVTNSISTLILPEVTELQTTKNQVKLQNIIQKVLVSCIFLGSCSCLLFFVFSDVIGQKIFNSPAASNYLKVLCWICPFLYTNTTLSSIINGLGKTSVTFFINCLGISIRIISILIFIPQIGINGYLWGLLFSQFLSFVLQLTYLLKNRGC